MYGLTRPVNRDIFKPLYVTSHRKYLKRGVCSKILLPIIILVVTGDLDPCCLRQEAASEETSLQIAVFVAVYLQKKELNVASVHCNSSENRNILSADRKPSLWRRGPEQAAVPVCGLMLPHKQITVSPTQSPAS
jgi:hypothetical protein